MVTAEPPPADWPAHVSPNAATEPALQPATEPAPGQGAMSERLAALPVPMRLLSEAGPDASSDHAAEPEGERPETVSRPRAEEKRATSPKRARASRRRTTPPAKNSDAQTSTVPRWAEKMFETVWQKRAFAYQ